ncbi:MAG: histidinol phosphate phosphatase [Rhizobiaceae bacterium MnEN-MB40S]|nr:MAG: histidinol phosphate phosphatase [Rhizobiaceae bacterium MnEN-MB40S]
MPTDVKNDHSLYLEEALRISSEAGACAMPYFRKPLDVISKEDASPVTVADRRTEELIRQRLSERFPDCGILGEEFGTVRGDSRLLWIVDPIDGTKSFISGMPLFSVLVALFDQEERQSVLGVLTFPAVGEQYASTVGQGAWFGEHRLKTAESKPLSKAMVYVNEGDRIIAREDDLVSRLNAHCGVMRFSYDAYSYCLLAGGHVDAVIDYGLKPYDYMAAVPLVEEAGGVITDWQGKPLTLESDGRVAAASSRSVHEELLEVLSVDRVAFI